jgi:hypothetical protein
VQLNVWERVSGRRPIQLAVDGTSPLFILEELADDPLFTGRVLIGIAPDIFFSGFEYRAGLGRYFRKESPSQRVGKILSMHLLEPWLAFYDPDFALFTVLRRQPLPEREGLNGHSVRKLSITEADRNNYLWTKLETDNGYRALVRSIWAEDFYGPPPTPQEAQENQRVLDEQIRRTAAAVARLRAETFPSSSCATRAQPITSPMRIVSFRANPLGACCSRRHPLPGFTFRTTQNCRAMTCPTGRT